MRQRLGAVVVGVLALALVAGACGKTKPVTPSGGGGPQAKELTGAGATFPAPLYSKWASSYETLTKVKINYQAIGSGGGIQQITAKTVDFGASDAPMKDDELAKAPGILHIPTVFGAVVITYNVTGVSTGLKLTPEAIAGIFLGKITKWNDPAIASENAGVTLPATAITPVHRSDGSGTTNIFTSYLTAVNAEWKTKIGAGKEVAWPKGQLGGKGNDGVTSNVKLKDGRVGYVELVYAKQNGLPYANVKNASGAFIEPSLASITAAASTATVPDDLRFSIVNSPGADAYPISGATWLLVYKEQTDEAKGRALVNFLWWATHAGQSEAPSLVYATLPTSLVAKAEDKIKSITFNGAALYKG
jgi:phosphate transport system substrate-binding protein